MSFFNKLQSIGNKAAQIQAAIASVPPKIQEARAFVTSSATQLQQLRDDVQSSVISLRTEDQNRLIESLREIDDSTAVFREAGYALDSVELELGVMHRLVVHLAKVEDVPHESIKVLIMENTARRTVFSILTAMMKAEELSDGVNLSKLGYNKLTAYVGPTPAVRLSWSAEDAAAPVAQATQPIRVTIPQPAAAPASSQTAAASFAQNPIVENSFFKPRPAATALAAPAIPDASVPVSATESPIATPAPAAPADWRKDALARFKKMPDLTKR
jgi:hypothetical protein